MHYFISVYGVGVLDILGFRLFLRPSSHEEEYLREPPFEKGSVKLINGRLSGIYVE